MSNKIILSSEPITDPRILLLGDYKEPEQLSEDDILARMERLAKLLDEQTTRQKEMKIKLKALDETYSRLDTQVTGIEVGMEDLAEHHEVVHDGVRRTIKRTNELAQDQNKIVVGLAITGASGAAAAGVGIAGVGCIAVKAALAASSAISGVGSAICINKKSEEDEE